MTTIPQCFDCRHYRDDYRCAAFPAGIPDDILTNAADHRRPHPGDHGIRFEEREAPKPGPGRTKERPYWFGDLLRALRGKS